MLVPSSNSGTITAWSSSENHDASISKEINISPAHLLVSPSVLSNFVTNPFAILVIGRSVVTRCIPDRIKKRFQSFFQVSTIALYHNFRRQEYVSIYQTLLLG